MRRRLRGAVVGDSRALTTAWVSAGSHVVHVFSPSRTKVSPSSRAVVEGRPPRAGLPLPSSVDAEFTRPPAATAARSSATNAGSGHDPRMERAADDLRVHRETERGRPVDCADRGEHLDRLGQASRPGRHRPRTASRGGARPRPSPQRQARRVPPRASPRRSPPGPPWPRESAQRDPEGGRRWARPDATTPPTISAVPRPPRRSGPARSRALSRDGRLPSSSLAGLRRWSRRHRAVRTTHPSASASTAAGPPPTPPAPGAFWSMASRAMGATAASPRDRRRRNARRAAVRAACLGCR